MSDPVPRIVVTDPNAGPADPAAGQPGGYTKMFPPKFLNDPILKGAFSAHADISSFLEASKKAFDGTLVKLPGESATPEEKAAWRKAKGVPEKADDYQFVAYADAPMTEASMKGFKKFCFDNGFEQSQASAWYENEVARARADYKSSQEAAQKRESDWKNQTMALWGADTPINEDRYKKALALGVVDKGLVEVLTELKALEHPKVKDFIQKLYNPDTKPVPGAAPAVKGSEGSLFKYLDEK